MLRSPETLKLTPGVDGYRIWLCGVVIAEFSTWSSAARGLTHAREALAMLETTLKSGSAAQSRKAA